MKKFSVLAVLILTAAAAQDTPLDPVESPGPETPDSTPPERYERTTPPDVNTNLLSKPDSAEQPPAQPPLPHAPGENAFPPEYKAELYEELDRYSQEEVAQAAQGADTPREGPGGILKSTTRAFATLCAVLALILLLYYVLRRWGKRGPLLSGGNLGSVIGRVYLTPRASLHFVRVRDRVLVVGVTANTVSSVAEFDAGLFEAATEQQPGQPQKKRADFLAELQASAARMKEIRESGSDEAEIAAIRDQIRQLQQRIQESTSVSDT